MTSVPLMESTPKTCGSPIKISLKAGSLRTSSAIFFNSGITWSGLAEKSTETFSVETE